MKTSEAIKHLQKLGYTVTKQELETFEIEGFIVTKPKICKTFEETKNCPEGFRLPKQWELFKIFEKMENRKKLSDGDFMFFWSSLFEYNYSKGLFLDRDLSISSSNVNLAYSYGDGRVVFVKELTQDEVKS